MSYPTVNASYQRLRLRRVAAIADAVNDALEGELVYESGREAIFVMTADTTATAPAPYVPVSQAQFVLTHNGTPVTHQGHLLLYF